MATSIASELKNVETAPPETDQETLATSITSDFNSEETTPPESQQETSATSITSELNSEETTPPESQQETSASSIKSELNSGEINPPESEQKSSVKPWLPWHDGLEITQQSQFGILSKLAGTWVNWKGGPTGMHTTPMPSPGTSSETIFGVFHFKSQEYREQLEFTKILAPVRNRGGSNEQFNSALKYNTAILDFDDGLQHFENGMYLWLGDNTMPWNRNSPLQNPPNIFSHESTEDSVKTDNAYPVLGPNVLGPQFVPPHSISRQGVIPHGTTIHLMGNVTASDETGTAPHIADLWEQQYLSVDASMGINPERDLIPGSREKPSWTTKSPAQQEGGGVDSGRAYFEKIFNYDKDGAQFPYTVQPNLKLSDANEGLEFQRYDLIELDTFQERGHQGGIINNVMIERYCRVVRMRLRMWIEEVYHNGKVIDQLQYEQIVFFEFMFGADGGTTRWPHIQVNTLRREEDLSPDELFPPIQLPTDSVTDKETSKVGCPVTYIS